MTDVAVLVMEGETLDRFSGGAVSVDAVFRAVLARGLKLTTDLEHLQMEPIPGWRLRVDNTSAVTLEWPHPLPLLRRAPLQLPSSWRHAAREHRLVILFFGYHLGLHEHAGDRNAHPVSRLEQAATTGILATGAVAAALPADVASEQDSEKRGGTNTGGSSSHPARTGDAPGAEVGGCGPC